MSKIEAKKSLNKGIIWLGTLILLLTWSITLLVIHADRHLVITRAQKESDNLAVVLEKHISGTFMQIENSLFSLQRLWESGLNTKETHNMFRNFVDSRPDLFNLISIIDAQGNVVLTNQDIPKSSYSGDRPFFLYHKQNVERSIRIGSPILGRVTGKWYIPVSMRLQNAEGKFSGVLLASINPYYFSAIFQKVKLGKQSLICLADSSGIIYSGISGENKVDLNKKNPDLRASGFTVDNKPNSKINIHEIEGVKRIYSKAFIKEQKMFVMVAIGLEERLQDSNLRVFLLLFIQTLISILIIFFFLRLHKSILAKEQIVIELDSYFTAALDLLCIADMKGNFIRVNKEWENVLGYNIEELRIKNILDFVHPDDLQSTLNVMAILERQEKVPIFTNSYRCKNGSFRFIEWSFTPKSTFIYAVARDITEQKKVEEELIKAKGIAEENETRFKALHNASFGGIAIHDKGIILDCNQGLSELTGYSFDELIGMDGLLLISEKSRELVRNNILNQYQKPYEAYGVRKGGEEYPLRIEAREIPFKGKQVRVVEFRNISEQKRAEEALYQSEKLALTVIENSSIGVSVRSNTGQLLLYNQAWIDLWEKSEESLKEDLKPRTKLLFNEKDEYYTPHQDGVRRVYMQGGDYTIPEMQTTGKFSKSGQPRYVSQYFNGIVNKEGVVERVVILSTDITKSKIAEQEKEKLQAQLNQSQKMESVGRLAGGIAHDFNNMLGVILGYTELILMKINSSHPFYVNLLEISKAAEHSANLTTQLLAFARKQTISPVIMDLNEAVGGMNKMLSRLIGEDTKLAWIPCANPVMVEVDPTQIDQILANLCLNAKDAIINKSNGQITIETEIVFLDENFCASHMGYFPGEYVQLTVSDNGCGMDKEALKHLFEPFFTTKDVGKGTGLGLATVYGIVKQNNGYIDVYSEVGVGTAFKIYWPRVISESEKVVKTQPEKRVMKGNETILLVEDEKTLLKMTSNMLQLYGYQVLATSVPGDAVQLAREYKGKIHLLLTDIIMPEMNGSDLALQIKAIKKDIKQLFMSGYTANVIAQHGVLEKGVNFIQKPFKTEDLVIKIREVLDN